MRSARERLRSHVNSAVKNPLGNYVQRWIFSLVSIGLNPAMDVIESGSGDAWSEVERRWIAFYRAKGARLANCTEGGEGAPGWGTPELRREAGRKRDAHASMTAEQRSARSKKMWASRTLEERSAIMKKGKASMTPAERSAAIRKANAVRSPETRREFTRRSIIARQSITPEQRSEFTKKGLARMTPEARADYMRRANDTRMANSTPEERTARARHAANALTFEQRSAASKKGITNRAASAFQSAKIATTPRE